MVIFSREQQLQLLRVFEALEEPYKKEFMESFVRKAEHGFRIAFNRSTKLVAASKESERAASSLRLTNKAIMKTVGGLNCSISIRQKRKNDYVRGSALLTMGFEHFRLLVEFHAETRTGLFRALKPVLFMTTYGSLCNDNSLNFLVGFSTEAGRARLAKPETLETINETLFTGTDIRVVPLLGARLR